ncbi:hypothetical protein XPA_008313 [Xanthoria parietina]
MVDAAVIHTSVPADLVTPLIPAVSPSNVIRSCFASPSSIPSDFAAGDLLVGRQSRPRLILIQPNRRRQTVMQSQLFSRDNRNSFPCRFNILVHPVSTRGRSTQGYI